MCLQEAQTLERYHFFCFPLFIQSASLTHGIVSPSFKDGSSHFGYTSVEMSSQTEPEIFLLGDLNPVKLTVKIKHHKSIPCQLDTCISHVQIKPFYLWSLKSHVHLNTFRNVSNILTIFLASPRLRQSLNCQAYNIKTPVMYFQQTIAQSKHSCSQREEWGHGKESQAKARLKLNRANTKSYHFEFGI